MLNRLYPKILRNRKRRIRRRLARRNWPEQAEPMMGGGTILYEVAEKSRGMNYGGVGVLVQLVRALGLEEEINESLHLLKRHIPYHESDHVLNIAYNVLLGGQRLEDIELRRQDEVFLDALDAQRIPDPTTAGDFTRRFSETDVLKLMECINHIRQRVWALQDDGFMEEAVIDMDGTISETQGECKGGMGLSYKGKWGYAPLILSLANTKEPLYLVNRPGNAASHTDAVRWIDRAIEVVKKQARRVCLRGDTAFSLTREFDRWDEQGVHFVFGMDAVKLFVQTAQALPEEAWKRFSRPPAHTVTSEPRQRPDNVKEQIVRERGYKNIRLKSERVAEFDYSPARCKRTYRMIVLEKNLSVERGETVLIDDVRYFFYITNRTDLTAEQVVRFAHERCDQENVIEQLKNGVNALRMPVNNLLSNWAYMVIASLAWTLKAWLALLMPVPEERKREVLNMEFRRFVHAFVQLPCQIVRSARYVVYRLLGYNDWMKDLLDTFKRLKNLRIRFQALAAT
jgi:hypothetical protein